MKQAINSVSDLLTFGKYQGKVVGEVAKSDNRYVYWLFDKGIVQAPTRVYNELLDDGDRFDNDWQDGHPFDFGDN